jgi:hypothetical protein
MNLAPTSNRGNIVAHCLPGSVYWEAKLGNISDEAMKRCNEALNASLYQFFASIKRFVASLLEFFAIINVLSLFEFASIALTL